MDKKPLISFIMPNYNNEHALDLFFSKFVENNTYDNYEFIITDDGSTDNGLDVIKKWQNLGVINNFTVFAEPHKGIINALNKCLFAAKGDFIIRLDGDATIETKGFVEKFLEFYNIAPDKIGVITSKVIIDNGMLHAIGRNVVCPEGLCDRGKNISEPVGKRTWDVFTYPVPDLDTLVNEPAEIDTALGVCTFSDRETALKIGGFDKNYPLWIEDDDFYLSYRLQGKKIFYLPDIEICHRFSLRGLRNPEKTKGGKLLGGIITRKIYGNAKTKYLLFGIIPVLKTTHRMYTCRKNFFLFGFIKIFNKTEYSWREKILLQDYAYWKKKWGFDILNPDMAQVLKKFLNTEVAWKYNERFYNDGIEIIKIWKNKIRSNNG